MGSGFLLSLDIRWSKPYDPGIQIDNMIPIRQQTRGIMSNSKLIGNTDLIEYVLKNRIFDFPKDHIFTTFSLEKLEKDFEKNRKSKLFYPDEQAYAIAKEAFKDIYRYKLVSKSKTITLGEALLSLKDGSTSPGYPYNRKYKTKTHFLSNELKYLRQTIDFIGNGGNHRVYSQASPKMEVLSIEKHVIKGKQRTFQSCDIVSLIVGLMLFKKQNDAMNTMAYEDGNILVGFSPFYGGCNAVANILLRKVNPKTRENILKEQFIGFDVSAMEASMTPRLMHDIYEMRWENVEIHDPDYTDYYNNLFKWYERYLIFKLMIEPNGQLSLLLGVNPSGQLSTLHDNCLAMDFSVLYNYARHVYDKNEVIKIHQDTPVKILGDDSDMRKTKHTMTYAKHAHEIGFNVTVEGEGNIEEVPFLNSKFHWNAKHNMYVFKPNFDKLMASVLFYFKKRSWRLTYAKLNAIYILVYPFDNWRKQIKMLLDYVANEHDSDMMMETRVDEFITYDQIKTLRLSDSAVAHIVYGHESLFDDDLDSFYDTFDCIGGVEYMAKTFD